MRITSKLKVYMTRIGVRDWLVAASSQKEALKAWDIDRNLFASGDARVTTDPTHVQVAMRNPGIPVAAPGRVVAPEEKSNVVQFTGKRVAREAKAEVEQKPAKHEKPAKGAKKKHRVNADQLSLPMPKKVDRSKLEAAEQELKAFERDTSRERAEIEKRKRSLELELEAFEAESERKRERLEKRVKREREALDE